MQYFLQTFLISVTHFHMLKPLLRILESIFFIRVSKSGIGSPVLCPMDMEVGRDYGSPQMLCF